jgi:hypothetical protein
MRFLPAGRIAAGIGLTIGMGVFLARPAGDLKPPLLHPGGQPFAGSAACQSCHPSIYQSHVQTAHFQTSRPASLTSVKGSFAPGRNTVPFRGEAVRVTAEAHDSGLYQAAYAGQSLLMAQRFDVVIGSGRKGQTYLYWYGNRLLQLPVSYYTPADRWSHSPGYPTDQVLFNRPVTASCLECHTTALSLPEPNDSRSGQPRLHFGIDCERCHGPAARHAAFHTSNPAEKRAQFVVTAARLSRQQRLDACAQCHSGERRSRKSIFGFVPGDTLTHYSLPAYHPDSIADLDVHGNQYGLLTSSKCFVNSASMTCSSCHQPHARERENMALFSVRCQACHATDKPCPLEAKLGKRIEANCVDCHMPRTASRQLTLRLNAGEQATPNWVRTHRIGIYPKQAAELMAFMKQLPGEVPLTSCQSPSTRASRTNR